MNRSSYPFDPSRTFACVLFTLFVAKSKVFVASSSMSGAERVTPMEDPFDEDSSLIVGTSNPFPDNFIFLSTSTTRERVLIKNLRELENRKVRRTERRFTLRTLERNNQPLAFFSARKIDTMWREHQLGFLSFRVR